MKANELRIGNLVRRVKTGEVMSVLAVDISTINQGGLAVEGIPLTEEWLKKFGFVHKTDDLGIKSEYEEFEWVYTNGQVLVAKAAGSDTILVFPEELFGFSVTVEYIHQLQNLYFALTGTELEIKP